MAFSPTLLLLSLAAQAPAAPVAAEPPPVNDPALTPGAAE